MKIESTMKYLSYNLLFAFFFNLAECDISVSGRQTFAINFTIFEHFSEILIRESPLLSFAVITEVTEFVKLLSQCSPRTLCTTTSLRHCPLV